MLQSRLLLSEWCHSLSRKTTKFSPQETLCMKCHCLFAGKKIKKNISKHRILFCFTKPLDVKRSRIGLVSDMTELTNNTG